MVLCAVYAALMTIVFYFTGSDDLSNNIITSIRYAAVFEVIILSVLLFLWEYIWKFFPKLNKLLFPNINGTWDAEIHYEWNGKKDMKEGRAIIKQNFINLSIEFITNQSETETLIVQPKRNAESGRLQLYYIYRTIPNNSTAAQQNSYMGTAILKFDPDNNCLLQGNYFTDRDTKGVFKLSLNKKNT